MVRRYVLAGTRPHDPLGAGGLRDRIAAARLRGGPSLGRRRSAARSAVETSVPPTCIVRRAASRRGGDGARHGQGRPGGRAELGRARRGRPVAAGVGAVAGHVYPGVAARARRQGRGHGVRCLRAAGAAGDGDLGGTRLRRRRLGDPGRLGRVAGRERDAAGRRGPDRRRRRDRRGAASSRLRSSSGAIAATWRGCGAARSAVWRARGCLMRSVTVVGAGSWGTALAVHLARVGHDGAAVGARRRARRPRWPSGGPTPSTCRTSRFPTRSASPRICRPRSARRGSSSLAVPSHGLRQVLRQGARTSIARRSC